MNLLTNFYFHSLKIILSLTRVQFLSKKIDNLTLRLHVLIIII